MIQNVTSDIEQTERGSTFMELKNVISETSPRIPRMTPQSGCRLIFLRLLPSLPLLMMMPLASTTSSLTGHITHVSEDFTTLCYRFTAASVKLVLSPPTVTKTLVSGDHQQRIGLPYTLATELCCYCIGLAWHCVLSV